jgi:cobalt-zinc-cadmium efflux system outer membrane protein
MTGLQARTTAWRACLLVWISFSGLVLQAAPEEVPTLDHPPTRIPSEEPALSLPDLERLALQHNPTLVQAAAAVAASQGKALQAGLFPNPIIGYDGDQIGASGTVGELQGAYVQQVIVTAGKLRLSRAKYRQEAYEAELLALGQQYRVLNGVRMHYYELLALQRMIDLHRDLLANAEELLHTHKEMFNNGQANRADVLLVEVQVNDARIALLTLENRYPALWQHLTAILASPELPPTPLAGQLEPHGPPLDWDSNLNRLLQESPELKAAQAHVVHDEITVRREKVEPIPNLFLRGASGYNFESNKAVAAGIEVGMNIPVWNRNQGTIRQAQADLVRSQAEVVRVQLSLRQRLADAFNLYRTAWQTAEIYRDAIIPQTTKAYDVQRDMYEKRRIAWPEVVVLQRKALEAKSRYTQSLLRLREAEVAIRGLLLVDGLTAPPTPQANEQLEATPQPR